MSSLRVIKTSRSQRSFISANYSKIWDAGPLDVFEVFAEALQVSAPPTDVVLCGADGFENECAANDERNRLSSVSPAQLLVNPHARGPWLVRIARSAFGEIVDSQSSAPGPGTHFSSFNHDLGAIARSYSIFYSLDKSLRPTEMRLSLLHS